MFVHVFGYVVGVVGVKEVFELRVGVGSCFEVTLDGVAEFVSKAARLFISKGGGVGSGAIDGDLHGGTDFVDVPPLDGEVGDIWHELRAGDGVVSPRWWLGGVGCIACR